MPLSDVTTYELIKELNERLTHSNALDSEVVRKALEETAFLVEAATS
jgi:hypothetical protein